MANQDIGFYKYLEAAFRYRLFNPQGMTATLDTRFNYLGYNLPFNRIFFYARRVLPKFYTGEFPDTEEGNLQMARQVLTDLNRRRNVELNRCFDPAQAPIEENTPIIEQAKAEQPISAPAAGPAPTPAMHPPSMPKMSRVIIPPPATTTQTETASTQPTPVSTQPPPMPSPPVQVPRIPSPLINTVRNFGSNAQIFARKNLVRIGNGLKGMAGGIGRGITGPGLSSTANILGRVGNGGLNAFERISQPRGIGGVGPKLSRSTNKLALGLLGGLLLFVLISGLLGAITGSNPSLKAASLPSPAGADITSCKFTRGNANPPADNYKSPTLLSYFQQASGISSVPAVVLAAIARVESPTITNKADADLSYLSSITGCPKSPTGALGIMQIQPPGTRGYVQAAVNQGASYLGKTVEQLTENDFCDLGSNIIIASGFILKKLQLVYNLGDGTKWDPSWTNNQDIIYKVAETYYGCLQYGGSDPLKCEGSYNYGADLWTSMQNCQSAAASNPTPISSSSPLPFPSPSPPPPPPSDSYTDADSFREYIFSKYGFTLTAQNLIRSNSNIRVKDISSSCGGGFWIPWEKTVELNCAQHEAAVHELSHVWWHTYRLQNPEQVKSLTRDVVRLTDGNGSSAAVSFARGYVYGIGDWKGMYCTDRGCADPSNIQDSDFDLTESAANAKIIDWEIYAGFSSWTMGNFKSGLRALPSYMWRYFEPEFTGITH